MKSKDFKVQKHHLLPKHAGGDSSPENITPPISFRLHAALHMDRWRHTGDALDFIAWKALLGRITSEESRLAAARVGQGRSEKYKNKWHPKFSLQASINGGIAAAPALVAWQHAHKEEFSAQCRANAITRASNLSHEEKTAFGNRIKSWWASMSLTERADFITKRANKQWPKQK